MIVASSSSSWRRVYGRSNMAALLHNQGIPPETVKALLSQTPSSTTNGLLHGSGKSLLNFEEIHGDQLTPERNLCSQLSEDSNEDAELDQCSTHRAEKRRRLTDDQVEYLEKSFETETRLEPERKVQLAKELGLQPRQVAIWFQNRRARWRTKQLEKDFKVLKSSFNSLQNDYDGHLKEKEKLTAEVLRLTEELLQKRKKKNNNNGLAHAQPEIMNNKSLNEKQRENSGLNFGTKRVDEEEGVGVARRRKKEEEKFVFDITNIDVVESDDYSSSAFEADHSDLSHLEDDEEIKRYSLLDNNNGSFGYEFPDDGQDLWLWH